MELSRSYSITQSSEEKKFWGGEKREEWKIFNEGQYGEKIKLNVYLNFIKNSRNKEYEEMECTKK